MHLYVCERGTDRVRVVWRALVIPRLGDWEKLALPDPLLPAYYLLRPLRLLARWLRALLRGRAGSPAEP
jgi:hypothetical protein